MWVNLLFFQELLEIETWLNLSEKFGIYGPVFGIAATMIESFFPPLPLALFVTLNVMMFGPLLGYIYSWIGTCLGSIAVYLLLRKYGRNKFHLLEEKYKLVGKTSHWGKEKGGKAVFILLCFPFTPSIAVAVLAALSGLEKRTYFTALIFGKMVMIMILSVIGYNIYAAIEYPLRLIGILMIVAALYFVGKKLLEKIENYFSNKKSY